MIVMGMVVIITSMYYRVRPVTPMPVTMPMAAAMAVAMSRATSKRKTLSYSQILEIIIVVFHHSRNIQGGIQQLRGPNFTQC